MSIIELTQYTGKGTH